MSPSELRGLKLGLQSRSIDRYSRTVGDLDNLRRTRLIGKFEATVNDRRHVLICYGNSRAGLWQTACRWLVRLQKGLLR